MKTNGLQQFGTLFLCLYSYCYFGGTVFKILRESKFHFLNLLHESFLRFPQVAGKFFQDFVCCRNHLSETSMQRAWIFHALQKVCLQKEHGWITPDFPASLPGSEGQWTLHTMIGDAIDIFSLRGTSCQSSACSMNYYFETDNYQTRIIIQLLHQFWRFRVYSCCSFSN